MRTPGSARASFIHSISAAGSGAPSTAGNWAMSGPFTPAAAVSAAWPRGGCPAGSRCA